MDVVGVGVPVFDQLLLIEKLPTYNQSVRTLDASWQYGGKVATAMAAVGRLGFSGAMVGTVGGIYGACIRADFERHGLDCSRLIDMEGTLSPYCLCLAEQSTGGRSFLGVPCPNPTPMITAEQLDKDFVLSGKWLLISGGDEASLTAARWFKQAGKPVVIDADGYSDTIHDNLDLIDHFIPSEFYYRTVFGEDANYEANLRVLRERMKNDRGVVILTLGEKGLVGIDEDGAFFQWPAFKVDVKDTTGAGDVFHGAYIAGRLYGYDAKDASRFASAVSAIKCTRLGGRAGIPSMPVVQAFLKGGPIDYAEIDQRVAFYRKTPIF